MIADFTSDWSLDEILTPFMNTSWLHYSNVHFVLFFALGRRVAINVCLHQLRHKKVVEVIAIVTEILCSLCFCLSKKLKCGKVKKLGGGNSNHQFSRGQHFHSTEHYHSRSGIRHAPSLHLDAATHVLICCDALWTTGGINMPTRSLPANWTRGRRTDKACRHICRECRNTQHLCSLDTNTNALTCAAEIEPDGECDQRLGSDSCRRLGATMELLSQQPLSSVCQSYGHPTISSVSSLTSTSQFHHCILKTLLSYRTFVILIFSSFLKKKICAGASFYCTALFWNHINDDFILFKFTYIILSIFYFILLITQTESYYKTAFPIIHEYGRFGGNVVSTLALRDKRHWCDESVETNTLSVSL